MKRAILALAAALAACGTPQEQCIAYNTRDLRVVDRLIEEVEGNLARGYALEEITITREFWSVCRGDRAADGSPTTEPCLRDREYTDTRPKAIDLTLEAQKLEGLRQKRADLAKAATAVIDQCRASYPE